MRAAGASRLVPVGAVTTMGTMECDRELLLFLSSLRHYHPNLPVLVGCTSSMMSPRSGSQAYARYSGCTSTHWLPLLDDCVARAKSVGSGINRAVMEATPGLWYRTLHEDFMMEKSRLLEFVLLREMELPGGRGCLFLDCDTVLLDPLPLVPERATLGLSRHAISLRDELMFGAYNGGFVFMADPTLLLRWRQATLASRYYDQASLESVADAVLESSTDEFFQFPIQCNFGYWRLFQQSRPRRYYTQSYQQAAAGASSLASAADNGTVPLFLPHQGTPIPEPSNDSVLNTLSRFQLDDKSGKVLFDHQPLQSVHSHLAPGPGCVSQPPSMRLFNELIQNMLSRLAKQNAGYRKLLELIEEFHQCDKLRTAG